MSRSSAIEISGSLNAAPASRRALLGVATLGMTLAAMKAMAGAGDHAGHDMAPMTTSSPAKHQKLIDSALVCIGRGQVCLDHCFRLVAKGDTSISGCLQTVSAMLPMCDALVRLAALDSPRLKAFAQVCYDVCADCEAECKKHASHHVVCKACQESCAECMKACKSLTDA